MLTGSITSSFRTDTEISGKEPSMPRERELQRWDAGADNSVDMSLGSSGDTGWDQFAANERMYGVSSTYDENIYTTQIDRSNPEYRRREAEAARIAREIEGTAPANAHVAEERKRDAERGEGLDEEEKYSGVKRDGSALPKRATGAYVPPSQRPITGVPTVPGAPFDPAIISSSLAKPSTLPLATGKSVEIPEVMEPVATTDEQKSASRSIQTAKETDATPQTTPIPKNTTEDHVRNVTDAFKQFANNEKLRARQMQESKRGAIRAEKNVKLNDLKKFAANFKLKSRVPDDLVPILAKEREKQVEIQFKAEEAAKEEEGRSKERGSGSGSVASPSSASAAVDPRAFGQHKAKVSRDMRVLPGQSPGKAMGGQQQQGGRAYGRLAMPPPRPLPADLRIPTGPAAAAVSTGTGDSAGPLSPTRLNVKAPAFEFRPAASAFTPSGTSPSPQRSLVGAVSAGSAASPETTISFFDKTRKVAMMDPKAKDFESAFNPVQRDAEYTDEQKKTFAPNGGIPQPYRTPPTWPVAEPRINASYKDSFPKSQSQVPSSQGTSPMHGTPNPPQQQQPMPHAHQLPPHLQQGTTPSSLHHRPHHHAYMPPPPPHHQSPHQGFDPRMHPQQPFGGGSVHSSPRFPAAQPMGGFGGMGMPPPQFAGAQGMGSYGMSPGMGYRQPVGMGMNVNMGGGQGGMMMMGPGQGAGMGQSTFFAFF